MAAAPSFDAVSPAGGDASRVPLAPHCCKRCCIRSFRVLDRGVKEIFPEDYLGASNELMLLTLAVAWVLVAAFNPEELEDNPIKDRFGVNVAFTALSRPPARYLCALIFVAPVYLQKRYGSTDVLRSSLMDLPPNQNKFTRTIELVRTINISATCLIFVVKPEDHLHWHFAIMGNYMFWRYIGIVGKTFAAEARYRRWGSSAYVGIHGVVVALLILLTCIQLYLYDEEKKQSGPVRGIYFLILEGSWLICLLLTARFMPASPSIQIDVRLCNDQEFQSPELENIDQERVTKDCLSGYLKLWKLFDQRPDVVDPEDYSAAAGEGLVLTLIVSWILGPVFNMDNIDDNPLKDRFGYNNVCVAWDEPPALYPAAVLFNVPIYCQIRYALLDNLRAKLGNASAMQIWITSVANAYMLVSFAGVALIFLVTPNVSPTLHTGFFLNLIAARYVAVAANFYEVENKYHKQCSWAYMGIYGFISLGALVGGTYMLAAYEEETQKRGLIPQWLAIALDYSWFLSICFTGQYLPRAPSLDAHYKLVNNDVYRDLDEGAGVAPRGATPKVPGKPCDVSEAQVVGVLLPE